MERRERVTRDRGMMAKRALTKAGYLNGHENEEALKTVVKDVAADFLCDIYHLAESLGVRIDRSTRGKNTYTTAVESWEIDTGKSFHG
jgi:hypothetical protein